MQPVDLNMASSVIGYQIFLFLFLPVGGADAELSLAIDRLGEDMENMHDIEGYPSESGFRQGRFQLLRAEPTLSKEQDISHPALSNAHGLIRLEATSFEPLQTYETGLRELMKSRQGTVEILVGEQRPRSYTSHAMTQFAYAHALAPGSGKRFPFGVVTPINKTDTWWSMDWMHRESFFLPRYDAKENLVVKGHALASEAGVPCINRRLVHAPGGYRQEDHYDFVGYFEFAEEDAPTFRAVMAALRDTEQNPEWAYVNEGPEWWGRRVRQAADLFQGH